MIKAVARLLLLRVLPRRILPIVTVVEAVMLIRSFRKRPQARLNEPSASRTGPPTGAEGARPRADASVGKARARTGTRR